MIKKLLAILGVGSTASMGTQSAPFFSPYNNKSTDFIYNILFCDDLDLFRTNRQGQVQYPWSVLFSEEATPEALKKIAEDPSQEGRVRVLAFNRLGKSEGRAKELLGVIVEVGLPEGLDVIAVFSDGGARYINYTGKMAIYEGAPSDVKAGIEKLFQSAKPVISQLGPWDKQRLPPPKHPMIRLTFLVSDGLYFGQGPIDQMMQEPMAKPIIEAASELLKHIVVSCTDSSSSSSVPKSNDH